MERGCEETKGETQRHTVGDVLLGYQSDVRLGAVQGYTVPADAYECPLYKTNVRAGVLNTTGQVRRSVPCPDADPAKFSFHFSCAGLRPPLHCSIASCCLWRETDMHPKDAIVTPA